MLLTKELLKNQLIKFINKEINFDDLKDWSFKSISSDDIEFEENTCISEILHFLDDDFIDEDESIELVKKFIKLIDSNGNFNDFEKIISKQ